MANLRTTPTPQGPYWYENLGEDDFQLLCAALLAHEYPRVRCYPVGQKDGGRDIKRATSQGDLIYQVKWSKDANKNPVAWLTRAIEGERASIEQHVRDGITRYILMTSIAGTAAKAVDASGRGAGTIDKLDRVLEQNRVQFGLEEMDCWWRADIDARVLTAPTNVLWRFQRMLAGPEAMRFLLGANQAELAENHSGLAIRKLVNKQWGQDRKVKFKQLELDNDELEDLFIDVKTSVVDPARASAVGRFRPATPAPTSPMGAVQYLLRARQQCTLVRGEPGQGKSTLGQQLCQIHRGPFIGAEHGPRKQAMSTPDTPRVPIRIDLRDYGSWLEGYDPFVDSAPPAKQPRTRRVAGGLEYFLAAALGRWAVVDGVDLRTINDLLNRYPCLLVLDGLDEVAQRETRARVVTHIEEFAERWGHGGVQPQVVVTTRPNVSDLSEPRSSLFEVLTLQKLDKNLRNEYLRKWAAVRDITGPDKRSLLRSFDARTAEPHIAQLAENPMQLTILPTCSISAVSRYQTAAPSCTTTTCASSSTARLRRSRRCATTEPVSRRSPHISAGICMDTLSGRVVQVV